MTISVWLQLPRIPLCTFPVPCGVLYHSGAPCWTAAAYLCWWVRPRWRSERAISLFLWLPGHVYSLCPAESEQFVLDIFLPLFYNPSCSLLASIIFFSLTSSSFFFVSFFESLSSQNWLQAMDVEWMGHSLSSFYFGFTVFGPLGLLGLGFIIAVSRFEWFIPLTSVTFSGIPSLSPCYSFKIQKAVFCYGGWPPEPGWFPTCIHHFALFFLHLWLFAKGYGKLVSQIPASMWLQWSIMRRCYLFTDRPFSTKVQLFLSSICLLL